MRGFHRQQPDPSPRADASVWRSRDFVRLWSADLISQFGTQISFIGLPLIAVATLGATPLEVSILSALGWLAVPILSLPAGAWIDRVRRRSILIATDLSSAIALLLIPLFYVFGGLAMWVLYVVAFSSGAFSILFDIAHRAYTPTVVDRKHLVVGNSALEVSRSAARIAGPTFAGAMIGSLTAPFALALDSLSFLGSAVLLSRIQHDEPHSDASAFAKSQPTRIWSDVKDGLRYVRRHRFLAPLAASAALSNFGVSMVEGILIVYMVRELGLSPELIGITFTVASVGLLIGAFAATPIVRHVGLGWTLVGSSGIQGIGLLLMSCASLAPLLILASGQLIRTSGVVVMNINQRSLQQALVPARLQGRTNATLRFIGLGTIPLGNLIGGGIATWAGFGVALWLGTGSSIAAAVLLGRSAVRSLRELPDREA